jgi:putative DNA primase/helicase
MSSLPAVGGVSPSPDGLPGLLDHHVRHLRESGLTPETLAANKIVSETRHERIGAILNRKKGISKLVPAIVFPFHFPDGSNGYHRVRPDVSPLIGGKASKYLAPVGEKIRVYFPVGTLPYLQDASAELLITEGEKKSLASTQHGFPCVAICGVNAWNVAKEKRLLPDLEGIKWQGREVRIVFDNDIAEKPSVQNAESWLAKILMDRGAKVSVVRLPAGPAKGLDDFLLSNGANAKAELRKLLDGADEPHPIDPA